MLQQRLCLGQALDRALNLRVRVVRRAVGRLLVKSAEVQLVTDLVAYPVVVSGELRVGEGDLLRAQIILEASERLLIGDPALGKVGPPGAEVTRAEMKERSGRYWLEAIRTSRRG